MDSKWPPSHLQRTSRSPFIEGGIVVKIDGDQGIFQRLDEKGALDTQGRIYAEHIPAACEELRKADFSTLIIGITEGSTLELRNSIFEAVHGKSTLVMLQVFGQEGTVMGHELAHLVASLPIKVLEIHGVITNADELRIAIDGNSNILRLTLNLQGTDPDQRAIVVGAVKPMFNVEALIQSELDAIADALESGSFISLFSAISYQDLNVTRFGQAMINASPRGIVLHLNGVMTGLESFFDALAQNEMLMSLSITLRQSNLPILGRYLKRNPALDELSLTCQDVDTPPYELISGLRFNTRLSSFAFDFDRSEPIMSHLLKGLSTNTALLNLELNCLLDRDAQILNLSIQAVDGESLTQLLVTNKTLSILTITNMMVSLTDAQLESISKHNDSLVGIKCNFANPSFDALQDIADRNMNNLKHRSQSMTNMFLRYLGD